MKSPIFRTVLVVGMLSIFGEAAAADTWKWNLTPYLWLTDLGVDVTIHERQVVNTTIDIQDLAEDIDLTLQVHAEGQHGVNGLLLDAFYVKLSDDPNTASTPLGGTVVVNSEITMTLLEVGGIFDPKGDQEGFHLLYGARVIAQSADIDAQFSGPGGTGARHFDPSDTFYDGLVGVRWVKRFGKGWNTSLRGDISAGGTDFTWNANATLSWSWGKNGRYALTGGYRYMDVQFKEEDSVESEMTLSGPVLGFRFSF